MDQAIPMDIEAYYEQTRSSDSPSCSLGSTNFKKVTRIPNPIGYDGTSTNSRKNACDAILTAQSLAHPNYGCFLPNLSPEKAPDEAIMPQRRLTTAFSSYNRQETAKTSAAEDAHRKRSRMVIRCRIKQYRELNHLKSSVESQQDADSLHKYKGRTGTFLVESLSGDATRNQISDKEEMKNGNDVENIKQDSDTFHIGKGFPEALSAETCQDGMPGLHEFHEGARAASLFCSEKPYDATFSHSPTKQLTTSSKISVETAATGEDSLSCLAYNKTAEISFEDENEVTILLDPKIKRHLQKIPSWLTKFFCAC